MHSLRLILTKEGFTLNKFIKIFTVSSATLLSVVSLAQATPTHADTPDSLESSSTGTLNIEDGSIKLSLPSNLNFGDVQYANASITQTLAKNSTDNSDTKVVVKDTTAAQNKWKITAHTDDSAPATLTINGTTISQNTDGDVFTKTDVSNASYGDQTININPDTTRIDLTKDQATKGVTKNGGKIVVNVNWTLSPVTTEDANFNS